MFKTHCTFIFSLLIIQLLAVNLFSQPALINYYSGYKYLPAQEEPPANWYSPEFDDSGWIPDTAGIGYGNKNQIVEISPETISLYLRYKFEINDPQNIKQLSFLADFDDGYIAYLNGKEILRINIDDSIPFPAYNAVAYRSHEQVYRTTHPVYAYMLDSVLLDTCLVEGENVIAVHAVNDSLDGSDLFFYLQLYNLTSAQYLRYNAAFRGVKRIEIDSVNFPLVIIETDEFGIPYKNRRVKAHMGIIDNGPGLYNRPDDSCNVYNGNVSIEVRGQSSSEFPKRSYRFELWDEWEQDTNYSLLGMPANDDWILFGPFQDKAHFRNSMIFDLARKFGRYQPRTRYCELIFNGDYHGLYVLMETVKRNPDRLNLARLRPSEISGNDVTGGYILKYDKPQGRLEIVYPKEDEITPQQTEYIEGFMAEYENILFTNDFMDPVLGFRKYINDTSLVDHIIMTEFPRNCDGYRFSTYFYKDRADRDNRLTYGPVWDNDLVFGNTRFQQGDLPEGWHFEYDWGSTNIHILRMFQDPELVQLFQERWIMARQSFLHTDSIMAYIDSVVNYIAAPIERNFNTWLVIDDDLFNSNYISSSYENEIFNIKSWIYERLEWIDDNIGQIYYDIDIYSGYDPVLTDSYFGFEVYPVPIIDELNFIFTSSQRAGVRIEVYDVSGEIKYIDDCIIEAGLSQYILRNDAVQSLNSGIYFLRVVKDDQVVSTRKIVKH